MQVTLLFPFLLASVEMSCDPSVDMLCTIEDIAVFSVLKPMVIGWTSLQLVVAAAEYLLHTLTYNGSLRDKEFYLHTSTGRAMTWVNTASGFLSAVRCLFRTSQQLFCTAFIFDCIAFKKSKQINARGAALFRAYRRRRF